jgi:sphingolipid delta-4 desaturase
MATSASATVTKAPKRTAAGSKKVDAGQKADPVEASRDFFWTYTEEPHRTRRIAIIKAHPEVRRRLNPSPAISVQASNQLSALQVTKLCGHEPLTKYVVLLVVGIQVAAAYLLRNTPFFSFTFWAVAYVVGATANQNLFLAIHEISHNLAFKNPTANRLLAIFANLPIGIPYSASFRPYHLTHHKSLGVDGLDTDLPTAFEAFFLDSIFGKAFFCTFQIFFYAIRPMTVYRLPLTAIHALNVAVQIAFDVALLYVTSSRNSLLYLLLSSFLAGSLHPLAGHFIAEHYVYETVTPEQKDPDNRVPVPETFSYYGPLNWLTYNVGLHNEHHDFPAVPWTRLPELNRIANDFYDDLPRHESWVMAIWRFILDENVGLSCRVKRATGGRLVGGATAGWKETEIQN